MGGWSELSDCMYVFVCMCVMGKVFLGSELVNYLSSDLFLVYEGERRERLRRRIRVW